MDYEQMKAMITARMKQWEEQKKQTEQSHADILTVKLEGSVHACDILLQDLETAHDILDGQE